MKNQYTYDIIYVEHATIGEPALLRVADYVNYGAEKYVMTPSAVTAIQNDGCTHTRIETEMSIIQTTGF